MPLTPAEMDALSAELAFARPDTCAILRLTNARGVGGGVKPTRTTIASVGCRVDPTRRVPNETVFAGGIVAPYHYTVALPRGTIVQENDEISVNGQVLQVVGEDRLGSYHAEVTVYCRTVS